MRCTEHALDAMNLQELLNKDGVTFEALVHSDECTVEDIVQEVKARNHKLLNLCVSCLHCAM